MEDNIEATIFQVDDTYEGHPIHQMDDIHLLYAVLHINIRLFLVNLGSIVFKLIPPYLSHNILCEHAKFILHAFVKLKYNV